MSFIRLKRLLYSFSFFDEFVLIYPLYAVMFADKGLNGAQISSLFIAWSLTAFLLEIPSGSIADKYSRKHVLLVAAFLKALAFLCWLLFPAYLGFLVGFIIWGISSALASGTTEAFVYDELKRLDKTNAYAKVIGRMESLELIGITLAALVASLLARQGYTLQLIFSILAVLISTGLVAMLPRAKKIESTGEDKYFSYLYEGVRLVWRKPKVLVIVGFAAILTGWGSVDEYWGLVFQEQDLSNTLIAFWTGVIFLSGAAGSAVAYKFENRTSLLPILLLVLAGALFAAPLLPAVISPLALCLFIGLFYISKVLLDSSLQHVIDGRTRATTTSVGGFIAELFALSVFGIFALSASTNSYSFGLQVIAVLIFVGGICYGLLSKYVAAKY